MPIEMVLDFFRDYWEQAVMLVTLCIVLATYWRARSVWKSRHFMTRVNFSLNYVEDGRLKIRTLGEMDIDQILLGNEHGKRVVLHSASRTTAEKHRDIRMNKIRVMIVEKSLLMKIDEHEGLDVERKSHHVRYETLKTMRKLYLDEAYQHAFMEIELATVADSA